MHALIYLLYKNKHPIIITKQQSNIIHCINGILHGYSRYSAVHPVDTLVS